jgi:hypothetical protein
MDNAILAPMNVNQHSHFHHLNIMGRINGASKYGTQALMVMVLFKWIRNKYWSLLVTHYLPLRVQMTCRKVYFIHLWLNRWLFNFLSTSVVPLPLNTLFSRAVTLRLETTKTKSHLPLNRLYQLQESYPLEKSHKTLTKNRSLQLVFFMVIQVPMIWISMKSLIGKSTLVKTNWIALTT